MALTKSSETATRFLQAAYRRLASYGYARLNMRDVAAESGFNHALFHYYFGKAEDPEQPGKRCKDCISIGGSHA